MTTMVYFFCLTTGCFERWIGNFRKFFGWCTMLVKQKKYTMVVIIYGFYSKILIFPFFAPKKNTSNTIKVGQVMTHQLNFFSKYSPTIRECANVQPNPKIFLVLGLFGIYVSATHVRTQKKTLPPPKIFARHWVITWKMLSANAPMLYEFCVQKPSQDNEFPGTFYLWPWIWWMRY